MATYLFVYGTLSPERAPRHLYDVVCRSRLVAPGAMAGRVYDLGEYPGAIYERSSQHRVMGRVFELPEEDALLARLDDYEGFYPERPHASLFVREQRPVELPDGTTIDCWVYLYNRWPGHAPLVPGGDYIGSTNHQHTD